ncbi:putative RNA helicase transcription factor interactor and regulator CCHC(Zn) family [Helianthus annuus]|nr:putative RNA helicase transcription factor interactor and regulator CCHC(Zn) family [Helianthus annuus]KAJ0641219.1 putative RNA helicase transcription factor interactor and regulator CCHC(Zn) family [Helianthus annuus]
MTSSYCPTIPEDIGAMALYAIQTVNWVKAKCPYQTGGTESGYNVLKFMKEVVEEGIEILANGNDEDIDGIREGVRVMGQLCFQVTILDVETCGKLHTGECLLGKKGCYKCGEEGHTSYKCPNNPKTCFNCFQKGHIKSKCPKLQQGSKKEGKNEESSKAKGRMFQITSEEAKSHPNVVSGIFLLNSIPVYVLFDTGATMSFISNEITQHPSFKIERMPIL